MDLATMNHKLVDYQRKLLRNLGELDDYNRHRHLTQNDIFNWYYQHLLVKTLQAFMAKNELVIPKHLSRYQMCFSKDYGLMSVYQQLVTIKDVDSRILKPAFKQLLQALKTQAVQFNVTSEVSQWRLTEH